MPILSFKVPAKINLNLSILARRIDGYHDLSSWVGFINLYDEMNFTFNPLIKGAGGDKITLSIIGDYAQVLAAEDQENNLILKAYDLLKAALSKPCPDFEIAVKLNKQIPIKAGLGGGSANAAAALLAFRHMLAPDFPKDQLFNIAQKLGADVPMFLYALAGENALLIEQTGDKIIRFHTPKSEPILPDCHIILAIPKGEGISTPACFKIYDELEKPQHPRQKAQENHLFYQAITDLYLENALKGEKLANAMRQSANDLSQAAFMLAPEVKILLEAMSADQHCLLARMSGSGTACFGLYADLDAATRQTTLLSPLCNFIKIVGFCAIMPKP